LSTVASGNVESHGGTVTELLGDGRRCSESRVAEDDAIRAVRQGLDASRTHLVPRVV